MQNKNKLLLYFFILLFSFQFFPKTAISQNHYWVFFKNKKGTGFNPYEYFDPKAIERRIVNGVSLFDSTDFPLNADYANTVANIADSTGYQSRWLNAMFISGNDLQIGLIRSLPFVKEIISIEPVIAVTCFTDEPGHNEGTGTDLTSEQLSSMQGEIFAERGLTGKGVRIAVFDAGFPEVDKHPAFRHLWENHRIIKTYDFIRKKENVYGHNFHGRMVLSCITGLFNGRKLGLATDAEFLLARTEYAHIEPYSEEVNWLSAMEWADKNGAQIISSSLGYYFNRYFVNQMDGKTSLVSRAARMAAKKGMLVITAMGNEGNGNWKYLITPADADSVLSVGGINPSTNIHISFSSFGPTADKRLKPNVCAFGTATVASSDSLQVASGTSFSTPLVAGFTACVLQKNPGFTCMQLLHEIEKSGNLYPYFDYAHGYGVPQAGKIVNKDNKPISPTFEMITRGDSFHIMIDKKWLSKDSTGYLYYHIENKKGYLDKYAVLSVEKEDVLDIPLNDLKHGETLRIHYKGFTKEYNLTKNK
ncbi:MAG: S8 family serine peptidase [Bacteroidia bacterium]|nr:S8 family serine peptidase [Bacteroidia bacterium]